ncbi:hypothetical protein [Polyangium mundeleinium]|uniref:Uncharacterized protein n=1 Tax=Polyangium mundeleinium TaxID=2995306 RepID=A0ABT5F6Z8_9BACT|nr:hypothetical protein [Polyangium mundeleinium]MDC0749882.1 hypothetical protein [Polyangium mundeleinium]
MAWSHRHLGAVLGAASMIAIGVAACTPEARDFGDTTSSSGSGGAGGSMGCAPNEERSCYTGPPGTEDIGACKKGVQICLPNGTGFGECSGDVLPQAENCLTPEDEACNGDEPADCPPLDHVWSKGFPILDDVYIRSIAVDPKTLDIVIAGEVRGTLDLGGGPLASTGSSDILLAKFSADGKHQWSKRFGDASSQTTGGVVVDASGMIYLAGSVSGAIDLGNGTLTSEGGNDALVAKFDANGDVVWAKLFGDASTQRATSIALTQAGQVVIGGEFQGTINLGGSALTAPMDTDLFVARLDGSGFHSMSRRYGGTGFEDLIGLALDTKDNIVLTGNFDGTVDFGVAGMFTSAGSDDVFTLKVQGNGSPVWAKQWGDTADQEALGIAITPNDEIVLSGHIAGVISFDDGSKIEAAPMATNAYLVKLGADGALAWSKILGGPKSISDWGMWLGVAKGRIVTAGWFSDQIDFGGGPLTSNIQVSPFIAQLEFDGTHRSSRTYTTEMAAGVLALGVMPTGDPILGGLSYGPIDFGDGPLTTGDTQQPLLFLARLLP